MIFQSIYEGALSHPDKTAIVHDGRPISYGEFAGAIIDAVDYLETRDFVAEQTAVVIINNLLECWVIVLALQTLGVNTMCVASQPVLAALGMKQVAALVTTESQFSQSPTHPDAGTGGRVVTVPNPTFPVEKPVRHFTFDASGTPGGHILYTSGTTGSYKKLFFSADLIRKCSEERTRAGQHHSGTIFHLANFGLWTGAGYKASCSVWHARGSVIIDQRPDWHRHFLHSGMTRALLIPDLIDQLLESLGERSVKTPHMDFDLVVSAGFISRALAEKLLKRVTRNLTNAYGSTEVNMTVLTSEVTDLDELHWLSDSKRRELEIVDEENNPCPVDVEGQLRVHLQEADCESYLDDPEATRKAFREGYFYPGDMAVRRSDGRIRILGRSADVINWRGQKLSVAPIEEKIGDILEVGAVCVFSGINARGSTEVVIAIEAERWPEKSKLDHIGREFSQFDNVQFAVIYPFPRTRTGTSKLDRIALRKLVFSRLEQ